jgi:mono/diheme cytochrome c family protein
VLKRVVNALEMITLAVAVVFAVLLVAYRPPKPSVPVPAAGGVGATVFASNCASCHGTRAEGGIGPKLSGGAVLSSFPDIESEIAVVTKGRNSMPAWGGRLSQDQILAVVEYTRTQP